MKKYVKLNRIILENLKDRALASYKNNSMDNRSNETFITECWVNSVLDELVKQGVLSFEHDGENKVQYYKGE